MRPLTFNAFPDRRVTVNPASVASVEAARSQTGKTHDVRLVLGDGQRSICVAQFPKREVAERVSARIGEHLWSDDAQAALGDDEQRLIDDHAAKQDDGFVPDRRSVKTEESKHPSLVAERNRPRAVSR